MRWWAELCFDVEAAASARSSHCLGLSLRPPARLLARSKRDLCGLDALAWRDEQTDGERPTLTAELAAILRELSNCSPLSLTHVHSTHKYAW